MQTIGLLIRLLEYTKDNEQTSLRILHMMKTLADEVPEMTQQIQEAVVESLTEIAEEFLNE